MSVLAKHKPKDINMGKLKKGIDAKIQAILRYLNDQSNSLQQSIPAVTTSLDAKMEAKTNYASSLANRQSLESELRPSLTLNQEQSFVSGSECPYEQSRAFQQRISLNQYLLRNRNDQDQNKKESITGSFTPIKSSAPRPLENSLTSSVESDSKKKIQQSSVLNVFGHPLNQKNAKDNQLIVEPFGLYSKPDVKQRSKSKNRSRKNTSRSKMEGNKENSHCKTPGGLHSKTKYDQRKTPFSNHYSGARKLFQYFAGFDREPVLISQEVFGPIQQQIEQLGKKSRKEGQDNNARLRLLKRIENCKIKTDQFLAVN